MWGLFGKDFWLLYTVQYATFHISRTMLKPWENVQLLHWSGGQNKIYAVVMETRCLIQPLYFIYNRTTPTEILFKRVRDMGSYQSIFDPAPGKWFPRRSPQNNLLGPQMSAKWKKFRKSNKRKKKEKGKERRDENKGKEGILYTVKYWPALWLTLFDRTVPSGTPIRPIVPTAKESGACN